ncbi:MAG: response regulator [Defluviitaleaceae bacterium]|nr:response regulator [Defluviitaleaceae bacterium]
MATRILVAEDMETNQMILQDILGDTYIVDMAVNGEEAYEMLLHGQKPALILSDVVMPKMNGYELLARIKANPTLKNIPVIFITDTDGEDKGLAAGAIDFITKPFSPDIIKLRIANQIELSKYRESLENLVTEKAWELAATKEIFLETMATMIEYRSLEAGEHIRRTKDLTGILVNALLSHPKYNLKLVKANPTTISQASALHDVGKIGIPDHILLKPGRLTPEEFKVIETHAIIGSEMIATMITDKQDDYLQHCYDIARYHHERWDGKGYPDGLAGEEIPISARIVALVDVYDALVSKRCYKDGLAHEVALDIIKKEAGTHFDADIVGVLIMVEDQVRSVYSS